MATQNIYDVKNIWNYLGTFWKDIPLEDKTVIEAYWAAIQQQVTQLYKSLYYTDLSKAVKYMPPYFSYSDYYFDITYSGIDTNTDLVNGKHRFYIDYIASCPELVFDIEDPAISPYVSNLILQENVHYTIKLGEYIEFNNSLHYLLTSGILNIQYQSWLFENEYLSQINSNAFLYKENNSYGAILKAPEINFYNPVIFKLLGNTIGFDFSLFENNIYPGIAVSGLSDGILGRLEHYKLLLEGLCKYTSLPPTINNISKAYQLARGAGFAYEDGYCTINGLYIHQNDYVYKLPHVDVTPGFSNNQYLYKFDILTSGVYVYDVINNPGLFLTVFSGLLDFYQNYIIFDLYKSEFSGLYSQTFLETYLNKINPVGMDYLIQGY